MNKEKYFQEFTLTEKIEHLVKKSEQFFKARYCDTQDYKEGFARGEIIMAIKALEIIDELIEDNKSLERKVEFSIKALEASKNYFEHRNMKILLDEMEKIEKEFGESNE